MEEKRINEQNEQKQIGKETYRFKSGKCRITFRFSDAEVAPTVEEALEKILIGRLG